VVLAAVVYEVTTPLPPFVNNPLTPFIKGEGGLLSVAKRFAKDNPLPPLLRGTAERSEQRHAATLSLLHKKPYTELRNEPIAPKVIKAFIILSST
jgi:hypothetical protein